MLKYMCGQNTCFRLGSGELGLLGAKLNIERSGPLWDWFLVSYRDVISERGGQRRGGGDIEGEGVI